MANLGINLKTGLVGNLAAGANSAQLPQRRTARAEQAHDPFLRKNQSWFYQPLPPSIERPLLTKINAHTQNHLDKIAARILDPSQNIERPHLVPRSYAEQLKNLREKIHALENQLPHTKELTEIMQNEITLAQDFYAYRIVNTPC